MHLFDKNGRKKRSVPATTKITAMNLNTQKTTTTQHENIHSCTYWNAHKKSECPRSEESLYLRPMTMVHLIVNDTSNVNALSPSFMRFSNAHMRTDKCIQIFALNKYQRKTVNKYVCIFWFQKSHLRGCNLMLLAWLAWLADGADL